MKAKSVIVITIDDNGDIKTDGRKLIGTEAELLKDMAALADEVSGDLTVEKHVHDHTHNHSHHDHEHN